MAPQLTATNGPLQRALALWIARANNSLPVPLSPRIRVVASLRLAMRAKCSASWMARDVP